MTTTFEHNGHTVSLTAAYEFEVSGPAFESNRAERLFESANAARIKIDERVRVQERQKNAREKLAIAAVDDIGAPCVIRGVHANTGKLLGATEHDRGVRDIFPPVPWLVAEVKRLRSLEKEAATLRHRIDTFRVRSNRKYGRVADHEYDTILAEFQREFAVKAETALAAPEANNAADAAQGERK